MSQSVADQLFLAYMGRAADTQWRSATATLTDNQNNQPSAALLTAFYNSAVSEGVFSATDSPSTLVNKIFLQIFGFAASSFEQTAWGNLITNGTMTAQSAAWTIFASYLGATNVPASYQTPAQSKLVAINAFSNALTDSTINAAYSQLNSSATTTGRTYLSGVTTQATAASAVTNVSNTVSGISSAVTGSTFTLTTGFDTITGGSGNDTINGSVVATITATAGDILDGGAGTNTLRLAGAGATATTLSGVQLKNIQVLDLINPGANDQNLSTFSTAGLTTVIIEDWSLANGNTVTSPAGLINLQLATSGNVVTAGNNTWAGPAAATTVNLTLAGYQGGNAAGATNLTITGAATTTTNITSNTLANAVGTLTLAATNKTVNITDTTNLTLANLTSAAANSVVVSGGGNLAITAVDLANTGLNFNASAATGTITLTAETGVSSMTFTGGSGNDTLTFAAGDLTAAKAQVLDGGSGTNTLVINDTTPVYATINGAKNFQVLGLGTTGATVDVAQVTGITAYRVQAGNLTETFNNSTNSTTYTIVNTSSNTGTVTINNAIGQTSTAVTVDYTTATAAKTLANLTLTGATTVSLTSTGTGTGGSNIITTLANVDNSTITVLGAKDLTITNALAATTTGSSVNASAFTGKLSVIGSTKADILTGGTGNDTLQNEATGTTASAGDVMTGGAGNDIFYLLGDVASGTVATILSTAARITDFTVGTSTSAGDQLQLLSSAAGSYSATNTAAQQTTAAQALGAVVVQSVAQNATAAAMTANLSFVKLTTGVTTATTLQAAFNAAIGTATITGMTATKTVFFSLYDTTNSRALIGVAANANGTNTVLETGDVVTLIGSINMTSADYANFGANNLVTV